MIQHSVTSTLVDSGHHC